MSKVISFIRKIKLGLGKKICPKRLDKEASLHPLPISKPIGEALAVEASETNNAVNVRAEINLGHFLTNELSTTASKINAASTSRAISFWQSYEQHSADWVKPLLELPFQEMMGYLHVYYDNGSSWRPADERFELAARLDKIADLNFESALKIFLALPAYPDLPEQAHVFMHLNKPYLQAKLLSAVGVPNALNILAGAERYGSFGDFDVAGVVFCGAEFSEAEKKNLSQISQLYFKERGGMERGWFLKRITAWKEKIRSVLDFEEKIEWGNYDLDLPLGEPLPELPKELRDEIDDSWKGLIAELIKEGPEIIFWSLFKLGYESRNRVLARMMEQGEIEKALEILDVGAERASGIMKDRSSYWQVELASILKIVKPGQVDQLKKYLKSKNVGELL